MAEQTGIAWTDSTFNPWWGCSRVSPGCDHCYAEAWDKRFGGNHWQDAPRIMSDSNWRKPAQWQRQAEKDGKSRRVFCASMCDVFDKNAPAGQRDRLWDVIRATPLLQWQLLTKRPPNIAKYLPDDWGSGYANVWIGVTVEDRKHGLPRIDALREVPAAVRFLSCEPLLEDLGELDLSGIHWVIVGGESGANPRVMRKEWAESIIRQCRDSGVSVFFKQWGGRTPDAGGCRIGGIEVKEWPRQYTENIRESSAHACAGLF